MQLFIVQDYHLAALAIFIISFIGLISNLIVAFFTKRLPSLNNAFGRLTASQATGEAILCGIFAFFVAPMVMHGIPLFHTISAHFGFVLLICYDVCCCSHLFIALNRMVAICMPMKYETYFSIRNTRILVAISWIVPILTAVVLYKMHPCDFFFLDDIWAFVFTQNEVCNFISWNIDFYKDISVVSVIAVVDIVTIYNVRATMKESNCVSTDQQASRRRNEINFLKQACLQGVVFVIELLTYFVFAWKFENKWIVFSLTTIAWILVHTTDAIIILTFNKEFRTLLLHTSSNIYKATGNSASQEHLAKGVALKNADKK